LLCAFLSPHFARHLKGNRLNLPIRFTTFSPSITLVPDPTFAITVSGYLQGQGAPVQPTDSGQPHPLLRPRRWQRQVERPFDPIQWSVPVQLGLQRLPLHLRWATLHSERASSPLQPPARSPREIVALSAELGVTALHSLLQSSLWCLGPRDQRRNGVSTPGSPLVSQQLVIHAGKEAVALSHLSAEKGHPLNGAGILEITRVDVTERRALR
jgi:hypothetical protein